MDYGLHAIITQLANVFFKQHWILLHPSPWGGNKHSSLIFMGSRFGVPINDNSYITADLKHRPLV